MINVAFTMQDFLQHFTDTYIKVSTGFVETLIQSQRGEMFTGAMRLHYPSGDVLLLTFLDGIQQKLYQYHENETEIIPRESWTSTLDNPEASIAFIKLSEDALRFVRVAHEVPVRQVEKANYSKQDLSNSVKQWSANGSPSILHLQKDRADKLYLIAGNSSPIIEELSWTGEEELFSLCDETFPSQLALSEYQTTRYISDGTHDIWQEYELRFASNLWIRMTLNRFSELAGRILTERLCEQLSQQVTDGRMRLRITINGVVNHQYFNSMEDEIRIYLEIIRRFREEAGTAIGVRMAENLVYDTLLKMDSHRQDLIRRHIYEPYMLDRTTGVGWR